MQRDISPLMGQVKPGGWVGKLLDAIVSGSPLEAVRLQRFLRKAASLTEDATLIICMLPL